MEILTNSARHILPKLPLDIHIPRHYLARRRGAISFSSSDNYITRPRWERRGAVSFERTEKNALYVRMLGDVAVRAKPEMTTGSDDRRHSSVTDAEYRLLTYLDSVESRPRVSMRFSTLQRPSRRRRPRQRCSPENASLLDDLYSGQIKCLLSTVSRWNFNIFTLDKLSCGRPLFYLTLYLFNHYDLIRHFQLDIIKLMRCISQIEDSYHSNNPYHHAVHAADVTQAMHCYLKEPLLSCVTPLEIMVAILASAAHDIDHPGVNQGFLIATKNHLADLYENRSVLENHHWRVAVGIIHQSGMFDHLPVEIWQQVEADLKSLVLATDITRQQEFMRQFKKFLDKQDLDMSGSQQHRHFILQIALKCADICNVSRPWELSKKWSHCVCKEFFKQGDLERQMGLPVTPNCDRNLTSVAKIQTGFIQYVVSPLFVEWHRFLPTKLGRQMLKIMHKNREAWERVLADMDQDREQEKENSPHDENEVFNNGGNGLLGACLSSPRLSLDSLASLASDGLLDSDTITETHYEFAHGDTLDLPLRLQLRRHSLPPNISNCTSATFLVRRQSVPYTGCMRQVLPKLCEKSVSYQGETSMSTYARTNSWDSLQPCSRITSLSGMDVTPVVSMASSPPGGSTGTGEEIQRYLATRRASFPLQKTISRTTFTSTRTKSSSREPLSQLNSQHRAARNTRNYHENLILRSSDRLSQKRFSDPGMQIPAYLLRSLESKLSHAQADASSTEDMDDDQNFSYRPLRLPLRRFSLEGSLEEVTFYERTSGK